MAPKVLGESYHGEHHNTHVQVQPCLFLLIVWAVWWENILTYITDTSLDQSITLDVPGAEGEYFITTYRKTDIDAMVEAFQIESVLDELISVPKP